MLISLAAPADGNFPSPIS